MNQVHKIKSFVKDLFHDSSDLVVKHTDWHEDEAIICYYSVLSDQAVINEQLTILRERRMEKLPNWGETPCSTVEAFHATRLTEIVCAGETAVILVKSNLILRIMLPKVAVRSPMEPDTEKIVRGAHDGFVEDLDTNIGLIRKRLFIPELVVKKIFVGSVVSSQISYMYIDSKVTKETLDVVNTRLLKIDAELIASPGQLSDYLDDSIWSPFPQLLNTERPDRVVANLMEGKVAIFVDHSSTALIGPVTFFSFFQTPDDYYGRILVGSFYKILRISSFFTAVFLPALYISIVSFHFEVLPIELSKTVKEAITHIPYPPFFEAFILEIAIELIREASIRLPSPVGQTIGIVGGLVIGDAVITAGLVSNIMVIVVSLTAISSFVIPAIEMNAAIRLLRFPFMLAASLFGFLGIAIGILLLFIHLLSLKSLSQPYFYPIIPFKPNFFKDVFFRLPFNRAHVQPTKFQGTDKEGKSNEDES